MRTRRYKPEETRHIILETARKLFRSRGYVNTSTSEIAEQAGVAEGSIFYHFGSKRNLLAALGRDWGEQMVAAMRGNSADLSELDPAITIPRSFAFCAEYGRPTDLVGIEDESAPEFEPFNTAAREVISLFVEDILRATVGKNPHNKINIPLAAALTQAAVHEAMMLCFSADNQTPPEEIVSEVIRFVRAGCEYPDRAP